MDNDITDIEARQPGGADEVPPQARSWAVVENGQVISLDMHGALLVAQSDEGDPNTRAVAALVVHAYRMGLAMGSAG